MKKVILDLTVSLDGYIEGRGGEIDWIIFDPQMASVLNVFADQIDTIIYGRKSYDLWGNYVPAEAGSKDEAEFYEKLKLKKKIVVSRSKNGQPFEGGVLVFSDNVSQQINNLKKEDGKDIWLYGGAEVIKTFMTADLIDEFRITINPIILGDGKPLFNKISDRQHLSLQQVSNYDNGLVTLVYARIR